MAQTKAPTDFRHDDDCELPHRPNWEVERIESAGHHACQCATREMAWIARESQAMMSEGTRVSARGQEYFARKRALLAYIEATR